MNPNDRKYSREKTARRGREICERDIRPLVEAKQGANSSLLTSKPATTK